VVDGVADVRDESDRTGEAEGVLGGRRAVLGALGPRGGGRRARAQDRERPLTPASPARPHPPLLNPRRAPRGGGEARLRGARGAQPAVQAHATAGGGRGRGGAATWARVDGLTRRRRRRRRRHQLLFGCAPLSRPAHATQPRPCTQPHPCTPPDPPPNPHPPTPSHPPKMRFSANMVALVGGVPQTLDLKAFLQHFLDFRVRRDAGRPLVREKLCHASASTSLGPAGSQLLPPRPTPPEPSHAPPSRPPPRAGRRRRAPRAPRAGQGHGAAALGGGLPQGARQAGRHRQGGGASGGGEGV
jgi:hypothetical protein